MARLQSQPVQLNLQWLPEEAVGSALRAMDGTRGARRLRVSLPQDLPLVHVDPALFERVLSNVLENAAKYTPPDTSIEISAALIGDRIRVIVGDHGPGRPTHREEAVFQMLERGRKESATPGAGLGRAICGAMVAAHGSSITGQTRPEGGARFAIGSPREEEPPSPDMPEAEVSPRAAA